MTKRNLIKMIKVLPKNKDGYKSFTVFYYKPKQIEVYGHSANSFYRYRWGIKLFLENTGENLIPEKRFNRKDIRFIIMKSKLNVIY